MNIVESEFDQITLFGPILSAQILSAYYSALVVKSNHGDEITAEVKAETLNEVFLVWADILKIVEDMPRKKVTLGTSSSQ